MLVALHSARLNGATISVLRAVPLLEDRGWRFAFWVPQPGDASEWLRARGATVHGEPRPIASSLVAMREPPGLLRRLAASPGYLRRFARVVREVDPDIVHANSLYSFAEALTARMAGRPAMLHVHDMAPGSRKAAAARALCRRGVHVTVAVSKACAASYAADGWSPRVVYEAAPIPDQPVAIRSQPRPFVVGTVGVIAPRKGSDLFVEAAGRLLAEHGDAFQFEMIGAPTDPLEREWGTGVLEKATRVGIRHRYEADVLTELARWDAFVLPSRRDPCPIVLLEAMASGLPVIGARTDGIVEQITPDSGLLVEPDDGRALARAILSLAERPGAERRRMGEAARARVAAHFSVERQADGLHQAYLEAIQLAERRRARA